MCTDYERIGAAVLHFRWVKILHHHSSSDYPNWIGEYVADCTRSERGIEVGREFMAASLPGHSFHVLVDGEEEGVKEGDGNYVGPVPYVSSCLPV